MSDKQLDRDKERAINWLTKQLAFERMLEAFRSGAGTSPFCDGRMREKDNDPRRKAA